MTQHRLAIGLVVGTIALIVWGGTVHATGSGLACGNHWPLCYEVERADRGEAVSPTLTPRMEGGVAIEHGHRLFASFIGLCTILLVIASFLRRPADGALRRGSLIALVLVVAQGMLGMLTVRLNLPMIVSTGHLCLSMGFLGYLTFLAFRSRPGLAASGTSLPRRAVGWAVAAVCLEIVLGALVRHTGSGPVCGAQFPLCNGHLLPFNGQASIHMLHRAMAFVVMALVIVAAVRAGRQVRASRPRARVFAAAAHGLVTVQVLLGIATVLTGIRPMIVTAHLGTGALLFVDLLALYFYLGPMGARVATEDSITPMMDVAGARA